MGRAPFVRASAAALATFILQGGLGAQETSQRSPSRGQAADSVTTRVELYGWVQADGGYDFGTINPDYFDRLRVSQLPDTTNEFGLSGRTYFSPRQTRLGLKAYFPTDYGELYTLLELDLIGAGSEAGRTTPHVRHAYAELGQFGAGQYWSVFVDRDSHPTIFESFGPTGLPWIRNMQFRWMPLRGSTSVTLGLEKPGETGEDGEYESLIEMEDVQVRFRTPEWAAHVRHESDWGHVQGAVLLRRIWWDDLVPDSIDLSGNATGWGVNVTPFFEFGEKNVVRLQYLVGKGVENYILDATVDIAPEANPGHPHRPIVGEPLSVMTFTGYVEAYTGKWGGIAGFSTQNIDNVNGQLPTDFSGGDYATATVVYYFFTNVLAAAEYQFGRRRNFSDGFRFSDHRLQLTFRGSFSATFGGRTPR